LISAQDGCEWLTSHPNRCNPEKEPGTHLIGGWVGHRDGVDLLEMGETRCPYWYSNPGPSST